MHDQLVVSSFKKLEKFTPCEQANTVAVNHNAIQWDQSTLKQIVRQIHYYVHQTQEYSNTRCPSIYEMPLGEVMLSA